MHIYKYKYIHVLVSIYTIYVHIYTHMTDILYFRPPLQESRVEVDVANKREDLIGSSQGHKDSP